jgi:hypothetical protein
MTNEARNEGFRRMVRCVLCRKTKGLHKAGTLHCPSGMKTRVGYVQYSATDRYTPNDRNQGQSP